MTFADKDETLYGSVASDDDGSVSNSNNNSKDSSQDQVKRGSLSVTENGQGSLTGWQGVSGLIKEKKKTRNLGRGPFLGRSLFSFAGSRWNRRDRE